MKISVINQTNFGIVDKSTELNLKIITSRNWSPSLFLSEKRTKKTFLSTDLLVFDFDDGFSVKNAITLFGKYRYIIGTTKSHQTVKNNKTCDRFRLILFFNESIADDDTYQATWYYYSEKFKIEAGKQGLLPDGEKFVDVSCKDSSRFYFPCKTIIAENEGEYLLPITSQFSESPQKKIKERKHQTPVKCERFLDTGEKGQLSRCTLEFLVNGSPPGEWNVSLYKAAKDLQEQGYDYLEAVEKFENMINPYFDGSLDTSDKNTIDSAFKQEPKYEPRSAQGEAGIIFPVKHFKGKYKGQVDTKHPDNMEYLISTVMGLSFKYNELKKKIWLSGEALNDFTISDISLKARRLKLPPHKEFIRDVVIDIAKKNSYHPLKQFIHQSTWDGKDHIKELFETLDISCVAEVDDSKYAEVAFYYEYLKRWLIGVVAKTYKPGSQNLVLVLQGDQGVGKSRWFEQFNISDCYKESHISPNNKDHEVDLIRFSIWNVAELDAVTRRADVSALKDFITKSKISVRKAFDRFDTDGRTTCSFCACVNTENFLQDNTGDRRYLVIPIKNLNLDKKINIQQVMAQAKSLFEQGVPWYFNKSEVEKINQLNTAWRLQDDVDLIVDQVVSGDDFLSASEIIRLAESVGSYRLSGKAAVDKFSTLLRRKGIPKGRKRNLRGFNVNKVHLIKSLQSLNPNASIGRLHE
ncbi:MAG: hypothetical protein HOO06_13735 [Bdellovibrionaceae bacterium]|jgi:hypothetical protein|nr:hypothetical protein [Pseudobdellovibrionaceae bacterium]